ncbi:MAG: saccharopine dehydrogenase C-terminal domain-containing protein [Butyricicoccus sp.]
MLSTTPIEFEYQIVPIQFLKALLPDPATLGPRTKGKTNIGCIFTGRRTAKRKRPPISTTSATTRSATARSAHQAISYTTGVPAMIGAAMLPDRQVEQAGRCTRSRSLIPIRTWRR